MGERERERESMCTWLMGCGVQYAVYMCHSPPLESMAHFLKWVFIPHPQHLCHLSQLCFSRLPSVPNCKVGFGNSSSRREVKRVKLWSENCLTNWSGSAWTYSPSKRPKHFISCFFEEENNASNYGYSWSWRTRSALTESFSALDFLRFKFIDIMFFFFK